MTVGLSKNNLQKESDLQKDTDGLHQLRALFSPIGSNAIKEEQWRDMTLKGVGILQEEEIPEELEPEHIRFKPGIYLDSMLYQKN